MSAKTNNFKLGLFTLFGIGLLAAGILAFGAWSTFEKKSLYETYVPGEISGLSVGSAVEFRGVHVGKVTHIGFSWNEYRDTQPGWVVVVFEMQDDVFGGSPVEGEHQLQTAVERGLRARLKAQGVTGTSIVSLEYLDPTEYPQTNFPWTPKNTYIPSAPGLLGDLLVSLQAALHHFSHLDITGLNQQAETDLKSVGSVLESVSRLLDRIQRVDLEGLGTNANGLLTEVRQSNGKIGALIQDTDDTLKRLQLEKLARDADSLVSQLQDTVNRLEPGLTSVDFDSLNRTLAQARQAIQNMDEVLDELKQYPSGFIFGRPPPHLRETQPTNK
jgi:ABC-type transporter Mla subunit MlaD